MISIWLFLIAAFAFSVFCSQLLEVYRLKVAGKPFRRAVRKHLAKQNPKQPQVHTIQTRHAPSRRRKDKTLVLKPISEANQDGYIGQTLTTPIVIVVETERGQKVTGVPIRFEVSEGDGLLQNRARVARVKTGHKGVAKMAWTMGKQVGPQKLRVSIVDDQSKQLEFVTLARPVISNERRLTAGSPQRTFAPLV